MGEISGLPRRAELTLLDLKTDMRALEEETTKLPTDQLKRQHAEHQRLIQEEVEKVTAAAQAAQSSAVWSTLSQIGACVLALFNIAAGGVLITTGTDMTAGAALVASGFLALANMALTGNGWNWIAELVAGKDENKKEQLLIILPLIISLMTLLLSASAYYKGLEQIMGAEKILNILQELGALGSLGLTVGKVYSEVQVSRAKIGVTDVEKKLYISDNEREHIDRAIETLMRLFQKISEAIKKSARETFSLAQSLTKV